MSIVINGSGSISGITAGGLPDGVITADDLASGVGGKVLQVINATYSTETNTTSTSVLSDTGLTASITPSSTSNKILAIVSQSGVRNYGDAAGGVHIELFRDSTLLKLMSNRASENGSANGNGIGSVSISYLDSPSSTSSITYKTQFRARSGGGGTARVQDDSSTSSITLMEIAA